MKVCFFGVGSIGSRHIRNLRAICAKNNITLEIDAFRISDKKLADDMLSLIDNQLFCSDDLQNRYDAIFVTNPTSMHFETILQHKRLSENFFIEKPVFEKSYNINELELSSKGVYYVSCPLRYSGVMLKIKEILGDEPSPFSVRAISSSYLPDWRPNVDYRNIYSAHKEQGGGVSIDLIHELDYLTYLFGMPQDIFRCIGKYSNLEINSDDLAVYVCKYSDKVIEIHLDYFGRSPRREVELYCKDKVIVGDLLNSVVKIGDTVMQIEEDPNDKYIRELEYFIDCISRGIKTHNEIPHAQDVLLLARGDN